MRIPRFLALLSLATLVLCAASFADVAFDFSTLGSGLNTASFTAGTSTITLYGFSTSGITTPDTVLAYKNDSPTEEGVGLVNDKSGENEIAGSSFIQVTTAGVTSLSFGSVQSGETWTLYQSNTKGSGDLGSLFASGSALTESLAGVTDTYISVFATGVNTDGSQANILIAGATAPSPTVPEPGTTAMIMTLGLVGLFEVGRRKLMA
jgi:PEP-CTERM motif